jgi:hypothetical protein
MLLYFCVSEKHLIIIELDNCGGISVKKHSWVDLLGEMSNFSPREQFTSSVFFHFFFWNHFATILRRLKVVVRTSFVTSSFSLNRGKSEVELLLS